MTYKYSEVKLTLLIPLPFSVDSVEFGWLSGFTLPSMPLPPPHPVLALHVCPFWNCKCQGVGYPV